MEMKSKSRCTVALLPLQAGAKIDSDTHVRCSLTVNFLLHRDGASTVLRWLICTSCSFYNAPSIRTTQQQVALHRSGHGMCTVVRLDHKTANTTLSHYNKPPMVLELFDGFSGQEHMNVNESVYQKQRYIAIYMWAFQRARRKSISQYSFGGYCNRALGGQEILLYAWWFVLIREN